SLVGIVPRHLAQFTPQRLDQTKQRRRLMADFVKERGRNAASDHALARHLDDGDGIKPAAWQPGARAPNGSAGSAVEVTDDGRWIEKWLPEPQRVRGRYVQS